jgi:hypothetical protein
VDSASPTSQHCPALLAPDEFNDDGDECGDSMVGDDDGVEVMVVIKNSASC